MTHSPLPWRINPRHSSFIQRADEVFVATTESDADQTEEERSLAQADAALIVRAVNNHAALVEALEDFLENPLYQVGVGGNPIAVEAMLALARATLTKAKEGSL